MAQHYYSHWVFCVHFVLQFRTQKREEKKNRQNGDEEEIMCISNISFTQVYFVFTSTNNPFAVLMYILSMLLMFLPFFGSFSNSRPVWLIILMILLDLIIIITWSYFSRLNSEDSRNYFALLLFFLLLNPTRKQN